ncbi:MAG TPA: N-acetylmuramic acid 6-phosphate etherase [Terriglobales bacterium]|nr:N-acetylmuramic acid 6-phosphate etherase [Terriglobales bacterium]
MKKDLQAQLEKLATEQMNPAWAVLDQMPALEIARVINSEDAKVAAAVEKALPQIACGIEWVADSLGNGGRLIYVGTGTSGRIAALDASECPPTFDVPATTVQFVMAGGERALARAVEADEDSREFGIRELKKKRPTKRDVVVGIAASGRTPFTVAAVEYARRIGAKTIALTCNPNSPLEAAAELAIVVETGPEVIAGSTRMKAGTAEKLVLNMLTTGAMVRLGYVYGNLMVNLHQKNSKLTERAIRIVQEALGIGREAARLTLRRSGGDVPTAIVMGKAGVSRKQAESLLQRSNGHVRRAIGVTG